MLMVFHGISAGVCPSALFCISKRLGQSKGLMTKTFYQSVIIRIFSIFLTTLSHSVQIVKFPEQQEKKEKSVPKFSRNKICTVHSLGSNEPFRRLTMFLKLTALFLTVATASAGECTDPMMEEW